MSQRGGHRPVTNTRFCHIPRGSQQATFGPGANQSVLKVDDTLKEDGHPYKLIDEMTLATEMIPEGESCLAP